MIHIIAILEGVLKSPPDFDRGVSTTRAAAVEAGRQDAILRIMRSVADQLREESCRLVLRMAPHARIERALRLGDDDARILGAARGISEADARRELAARRQSGRRQSESKRR